MSKRFKNCGGEWFIVEYMDVDCELCESHIHNMAQYQDELIDLLAEVPLYDKRPDPKRLMMYWKFIWIKHMQLRTYIRCQLCKCVYELIQLNLPVELYRFQTLLHKLWE